MMTEIRLASLLEKIADLHGQARTAPSTSARTAAARPASPPSTSRSSAKTEGKTGIDIRIKPGTKGEQCHIPVIITQDRLSGDGLQRLLHRRGLRRGHRRRLRHPQLRLRRQPPRRHPHLLRRQKLPCPLLGEALRRGRRQRQARHESPDHRVSGGGREHPDGHRADPRHRLHQALHQDRLRQGCRGASSPSSLLTHGHQDGHERHGDRARTAKIPAGASFPAPSRRTSPARSSIPAWSATRSASVMCSATPSSWAAPKIRSIPEIAANSTDAQLIHEAAIGKIAGDQLLKLQTLGLTAEEAEDTILKGFLA